MGSSHSTSRRAAKSCAVGRHGTMTIESIQAHKVEHYYVKCSCGMTVESLRTAPGMTLKEFTLWMETFLCKHEASAVPSPDPKNAGRA